MKKDIFKMEDNTAIEKNMVKLIEDEDTNVSGASTPACAISATVASATAVSALLTCTSACTRACRRF